MESSISELMTSNALNFAPVYSIHHHDHTLCLPISCYITKRRYLAAVTPSSYQHDFGYANCEDEDFICDRIIRLTGVCRIEACYECHQKAVRTDNLVDMENDIHYSVAVPLSAD